MYEWLKAFHVIAVIAWMAGMLYLPRLFVYHCAAEVGSKQSETFKVMERRLLTAIMNPAMVATLGARSVARLEGGTGSPPAGCRRKSCWSSCSPACMDFCLGCVRDFAADRNRHSQKFYRIINEVPTVLMIGIVILAVVKPF